MVFIELPLKTFFRSLAWIAYLTVGAVAIAQSPSATPIEITADGENRFMDGVAYASGNVVVRYGADVVYADEIRYDNKRKEISALGNVRIYTDGQFYRADEATYNFESKRVESRNFLSAQNRIYASGEELRTISDTHYQVKDGIFTPDNRENPAVSLHAKTVEIYPDDRIVLKNSVLKIGEMPVMWIPYAFYSLREDSTMYEVALGSRGKWGFYTLHSLNWQYSKQLSGNLNFDYRTKRGFGGGVDLKYKPLNDKGIALFKSFGTNDDGNDIDVGSPDRPLEPPAKRFRIEYQHNLELSDNLYTIADINIWSDRHVTQDFFPREFEQTRQPDNVLQATFYDDNFTAGIMGRSQVNGLFQVTERKPQVSFEVKEQKIPHTPLYYKGEASATSLEMNFDRDNPASPSAYRSVRYDIYNQILYPRQYFSWLNLTPHAGVRNTAYTRNNAPGNPQPTGEKFRTVFDVGLDASFKVSKTWLDVRNDELGIQGIRHVIEPFANFAYQPKPDTTAGEVRGFDDYIPNTRLAPMHYSAYRSIDSLDAVTTLRHGIRQRVQTKRDGMNVNLFEWAIYGNLDLEREQAVVVNEPYPELYNDVSFRPLPWLRLDIESAAGLTSNSFDYVDAKLVWQIHPAVEVETGFNYLDDFRIFEDSQLYTFGVFYRLNENWQFRQELKFEGDDGTLQEQRYTVYRDLTAWNIAFSFASRDNRDVDDELLFYLSLTLKAFPEQDISVNY